MRCAHAHEHSTALCGYRSTSPKVRAQRLTDVIGQRKAFEAIALAPYQQFARAPVDVFQSEAAHLAGAHAQPREQHQHREVAPTHCGSPITGREQAQDVTRLQ